MLGGGLHELAFTQGAAGVHDGGLGFRTAAWTQTILFFAFSRGIAHPLDGLVCDVMVENLILLSCAGLYDSWVNRVTAHVLAGLSPARA